MKIQDAKNGQKIRHLGTITHLCRAAIEAHIDNRKKIVKQQYLPHMSLQYCKLRPTNGWDRFTSLGHPSTSQRVPRIGSVTARHSSSGRQPNFAALNRGRHLYLAGRPSQALAHILVDLEAVAKHCDEYVCLWVCLSVCVCLSVRDDISRTTRSIFTKFFVHVACVSGSVLLQHVYDRPHRLSPGMGFLLRWKCIIGRERGINQSINNF